MMSKDQSVDYFIKPVGDRIIGSFTDFTILSYKNTYCFYTHQL